MPAPAKRPAAQERELARLALEWVERLLRDGERAGSKDDPPREMAARNQAASGIRRRKRPPRQR